MRLIEKKCPNCGASLEFDENAVSCKCNYCNRSFEIERDVNDLDKINLVFDKVQKPFKYMFLAPLIGPIVVFLFVFIFFSLGFHNTAKSIDEHSVINNNTKLILSVDELTDKNIDDLEILSHSVLNQSVAGQSNNNSSYMKTGDPRLEKVYLATKKDANVIVLIFNVKYHDFFHQEDQQTVYVPAVFKNIKNNEVITDTPKNPAPEYYFNDEKSSYVYAYSSLDDTYNGVVKNYENNGYKIKEKEL